MKQYTVQEVAMALGVDIQTVYNWLSRDGVFALPHDPGEFFREQCVK